MIRLELDDGDAEELAALLDFLRGRVEFEVVDGTVALGPRAQAAARRLGRQLDDARRPRPSSEASGQVSLDELLG